MKNMSHGTETTLGDFALELWRARGFVLCGLIVGFVGAALFVLSAVPHGSARLVIAPASPMEAMQISANQNRPVAADDSQKRADSNFARFDAVMKGVSAARILLREDDILTGLENDRAYRFDDSDQQWSPSKLAEYIESRVHVDPVGETSLRILSYEHSNPNFAALFLRRLHEVSDGLIRHSMRRDVNERIQYLQKSLGNTMNPEHRRALTDLLMEQERLKMLVSIEQPYAAALVEPAAAMPRQSWPDVPLVFAALGFGGAFMGFVIFSIMQATRSAPAQRTFKFNEPEAEPAFKRSDKLQSWIKKNSENNNEPLDGRASGSLSSRDAAE